MWLWATKYFSSIHKLNTDAIAKFPYGKVSKMTGLVAVRLPLVSNIALYTLWKMSMPKLLYCPKTEYFTRGCWQTPLQIESSIRRKLIKKLNKNNNFQL